MGPSWHDIASSPPFPQQTQRPAKMSEEQTIDQDRPEVQRGSRSHALSPDQRKGGIEMNIIAYQRPSHIYRSDSFPASFGG